MGNRLYLVILFLLVPENAGFMLKASTKGIPLKIIQLNGVTDINETVKHLLTWSNEMSSLGVILDYKCYGSNKLIEMVIFNWQSISVLINWLDILNSYLKSSLSLCFSKKFKWLIYEEKAHLNNSFLIKQLKRTKLFVDADISYITFDTTDVSTLNDK